MRQTYRYVFRLGVHVLSPHSLRVYNQTIDQLTGRRYDTTLPIHTREAYDRWLAYLEFWQSRKNGGDKST